MFSQNQHRNQKELQLMSQNLRYAVALRVLENITNVTSKFRLL